MIPFKQLDKKIAIIKDTCYSAIHIQPEKYCESFVDCEIKVDLENIKKGTTVVVTCFNSQLESDVNNTKYILRNGFLYQLPKHKNIQDTWRLKKM